MPRPDPADAQAVWTLPAGYRARPNAHYLIVTAMLLVPMTLTATLGSITFSSPDGTAIVSFWPAASFQVVFSIWFGVYGALAGIIGPMLGNSLVGESAFLFIPANAVQSCLAGLWFRYRMLDPRLRSRRDWIGLIVVGCVLSNAAGAAAGVGESVLRRMASGGLTEGFGFWFGKALTWFLGNTVPCLLLAPALLKAASPTIVRDPMFCQSFWGGVAPRHRPRLRFRFVNLPMSGKLMVLVMVAGILPLLVVAAWSVWGAVKTADRLAVEMNRKAALEMRNEIERHELLLSIWSAQLDQPGLEEEDRRQLLNGWRSEPEGFEMLEIADRARVEAEMSPDMLAVFRDHQIVFYRTGKKAEAGPLELRGVVGLRLAPDHVLTGVVKWRTDGSASRGRETVEGVLVVDEHGHEIDRNVPPDLADWRPGEGKGRTRTYTAMHAGRTWHVAEAVLLRQGIRFIALTSSRTGLMTGLASIPNPVAVLVNLAIFVSLITGGAIAGRISRRVLGMAESVREAGGEPGKLYLPVPGRDELGYLAQTLNRMSDDLAVSIRQLQETIAEKERLAAEMELARQVQRKIRPSESPRVSGYELAAACYPAREVGGDFFDWFVRDDGSVVTRIGDAAGKGLRAAMFITEAHALARAAAMWHPAPGPILTAVNSTMVSEGRAAEDFVTVLCAVLEPARHSLLYASAGHNSPILLHEGRTHGFDSGGLPLAILPEEKYPFGRIELAAGDALILYTDGVVDAVNVEGQFFGLERLESVALRHVGLSAEGLVEAILKAVREFTLDARQTDDMTLMVLRRCD